MLQSESARRVDIAFVRQVLETAGRGTPPTFEAVGQALEKFLGRDFQGHVLDCVERARELSPLAVHAPAPGHGDRRDDTRVRPGEATTLATYAAALPKWARGVRVRVFGDPSVPFRTFRAAAVWVEAGVTGGVTAQLDGEPEGSAFDRAKAAIHSLERTTKMSWRLEADNQFAYYPISATKSQGVTIGPMSSQPLRSLSREIAAAAEITGIKPEHLARLVLVGGRVDPKHITPLTWSIGLGFLRLPGEDDLPIYRAHIRMHVREVTAAEMTRVRTAIRRAWRRGPRAARPFRRRDQVLCEIVRKVPPRSGRAGAAEDWDRIAAQTRSRCGPDGFATGKAAQMQARRLKARGLL